MEAGSSIRVDSWIWAVRLAKTRSQATAACRAGHVRVNGEKVKAAQAVRTRTSSPTRTADAERIVVVKRILAKRVSAVVAAESLTDNTPPPPAREDVPFVPIRDRGAGRPTKRERRDIEKLRGH
jgi:ribosome-associated heat shock protein Hsp15